MYTNQIATTITSSSSIYINTAGMCIQEQAGFPRRAFCLLGQGAIRYLWRGKSRGAISSYIKSFTDITTDKVVRSFIS